MVPAPRILQCNYKTRNKDGCKQAKEVKETMRQPHRPKELCPVVRSELTNRAVWNVCSKIKNIHKMLLLELEGYFYFYFWKSRYCGQEGQQKAFGLCFFEAEVLVRLLSGKYKNTFFEKGPGSGPSNTSVDGSEAHAVNLIYTAIMDIWIKLLVSV